MKSTPAFVKSNYLTLTSIKTIKWSPRSPFLPEIVLVLSPS